ncbi:hypothetical protein [Streptomyces anulatus]|uniref:hypothetical protein n=1 Tax=Streptomyces anulatus TaxID=1892 RepID=UPI0037DDD329|nr:hypothetical protein OHB50_39530 [Streptomyces anulatus]
MSVSTPIAHAQTAAPLAALLPARRGIAWKVTPAEYGIRANAAMSRITDGFRSLIVVEQAGVIEVYADRPDDFAVTPEVTVDAAGPDPVAALAAHVLRCTLPLLDTERAAETLRTGGDEQALRDRVDALTEVGFALIDHGAHAASTVRLDGEGLEWTTSQGGQWWMQAISLEGTLCLGFCGPVSGLYALLPSLLPPADGHAATGAGSAFTRHLTGRFPQLRPLADDEVEFGGYRQPHGWIATSGDTSTAGDDTRVAAQFSVLGPDLLLTAASHLL